LRIAILGFGVVGSAVARRLTGSGAIDGTLEVELTHVFDRRAEEKSRAFSTSSAAVSTPWSIPFSAISSAPSSAGVSIVWTDRIEDVLESDVEVIVETTGTIEPATAWIRHALVSGKSVVTANKQVIARHGSELWELAAKRGSQLRFEAAIGGAVPIVRAVVDGMAGDEVVKIEAILNGTTNLVLSRMEATGCSLEDALDEARRLGCAESDASYDLDGLDAAAKLAILCSLAFGTKVDPDEIATRSAGTIAQSDVARAAGQCGAIRQLAHAAFNRETSTLTAWVSPVVVPQTSIFGQSVGPQNVAVVTGTFAGEVGIFGTGAGGAATSSAILSDVLAIARDRTGASRPFSLVEPNEIVGLAALEAGCAIDWNQVAPHHAQTACCHPNAADRVGDPGWGPRLEVA
jgi:homoserine dehydrogenase